NVRIPDVIKLAVELFHGQRGHLAALGQTEGSGSAPGPIPGRLTVFTNRGQVVVFRAFTNALGEVIGVVALADRHDPGHAPTSHSVVHTFETDHYPTPLTLP